VSIFGSRRIRGLRIGEALLILPRIAHGIVAAVFSERAVGTVGKVLCALHGRNVHSAWEGGAG
jgi:hypothetical protein